jgi:hypothetical protein
MGIAALLGIAACLRNDPMMIDRLMLSFDPEEGGHSKEWRLSTIHYKEGQIRGSAPTDSKNGDHHRDIPNKGEHGEPPVRVIIER